MTYTRVIQTENPVISEDSFRLGRMTTHGESYNTPDDILYWTVVIKMTGLGRQFLKWDDVEKVSRD